MFSTTEFINVSRDFVCIRLETYESKANQDIVRKFLEGRLENTVFCVLAPDGETRLSDTGRNPMVGLGVHSRPTVSTGEKLKQDNIEVIAALSEISKEYPALDKSSALVMDFNSLKQSLNISSGDQRPLVYIVGTDEEKKALKTKMINVVNDTDIIGRFHYDFQSDVDTKWTETIDGETGTTGIFIIHPDEFGQKGKVLSSLTLDSDLATIKTTLIAANKTYVATETRKDYNKHRAKAKAEGVTYEDTMPWGEDRDADGEIDPPRERRGPKP